MSCRKKRIRGGGEGVRPAGTGRESDSEQEHSLLPPGNELLKLPLHLPHLTAANLEESQRAQDAILPGTPLLPSRPPTIREALHPWQARSREMILAGLHGRHALGLLSAVREAEFCRRLQGSQTVWQIVKWFGWNAHFIIGGLWWLMKETASPQALLAARGERALSAKQRVRGWEANSWSADGFARSLALGCPRLSDPRHGTHSQRNMGTTLPAGWLPELGSGRGADKGVLRVSDRRCGSGGYAQGGTTTPRRAGRRCRAHQGKAASCPGGRPTRSVFVWSASTRPHTVEATTPTMERTGPVSALGARQQAQYCATSKHSLGAWPVDCRMGRIPTKGWSDSCDQSS